MIMEKIKESYVKKQIVEFQKYEHHWVFFWAVVVLALPFHRDLTALHILGTIIQRLMLMFVSVNI